MPAVARTTAAARTAVVPLSSEDRLVIVKADGAILETTDDDFAEVFSDIATDELLEKLGVSFDDDDDDEDLGTVDDDDEEEDDEDGEDDEEDED